MHWEPVSRLDEILEEGQEALFRLADGDFCRFYCKCYRSHGVLYDERGEYELEHEGGWKATHFMVIDEPEGDTNG